jgi:hypothetical protein
MAVSRLRAGPAPAGPQIRRGRRKRPSRRAGRARPAQGRRFGCRGVPAIRSRALGGPDSRHAGGRPTRRAGAAAAAAAAPAPTPRRRRPPRFPGPAGAAAAQPAEPLTKKQLKKLKKKLQRAASQQQAASQERQQGQAGAPGAAAASAQQEAFYNVYGANVSGGPGPAGARARAVVLLGRTARAGQDGKG